VVFSGQQSGGPRLVQRCAPAKVNLVLSVGAPLAQGLRAGMHPIASWMHCIELADDVVVEALADGRASSHRIAWAADAVLPTAIDWPLEDDLAVRAHRALERQVGQPLAARIEVRKRIPVGAGLGGGSSDAAAALLALNQVFALDLTVGMLAGVAGQLGSDLAFFLDEGVGDDQKPARPALVMGTGETIQRLPRCDQVLVLLLPPLVCPTGAIYRAYDELGPGMLHPEAVRWLSSRRLWPGAPLFNDLAAAAQQLHPQLGLFRQRCQEVLHQPVHITGSGSAMFAIAGGQPHARELAQRVAGAVPEVVAMVVRLV
jgi:4-diphosphocytidyl-2-C-methyl-D-erythritol kinase